MIKVLVTGCSGFIGSHLITTLIENKNYDVYGMDIKPLPEDFKYKTLIKFYQEDIRNSKLYSILNEKPNIVIHLAALAGVGNSCKNPCEYIDVNIKGTTNIILNCLEVNCNKIIYASSSSIYGNEDNCDKLETTIRLQSPYSITKKTCEIIFDYYNRMNNISCIGLRFFSVYGPNGRKDMAPHIFIDSIINDKVITINGDGNITRDFTYITDIVSGILASINYINDENNGIINEVFNLGNGTPISINKFIEYIEDILNKKAIINYGVSKKYDNNFTCANLNKSKKLLNYNPTISIKDGLILTINSHLIKNRNL
jgi:UDP-glucuronate 4-epimerase